MPPKLGDTSYTDGAASQNASGAASISSAQGRPAAPASHAPQQGQGQQAPPQPPQPPQPAQPRRTPQPVPQGRDDDAVPEPPPREGEEGGGFTRKRWDEYSKLITGKYVFLACVNQIVRWESGVSQSLKVLSPGADPICVEHNERQVEWQQSPPRGQSDGFNFHWRKRFIGAYAAGGWTVEANENGWDGWQASNQLGASGQPLPLPPYDRYFVVHTSGLWVPTVLEVTVEVDAPPHDKFPKITAIRPLVVDGRRVQAPMPWRVIDWISESLGWYGTVEAVNKATRPVVKLDYQQLEQGAGGLMWWRDAIRRIGELQGSPYVPTVPKREPANPVDLPF